MSLHKRIIYGSLLVAANSFSSYSGYVIEPNGIPKVGVNVLLVRHGLAATTDNSGFWKIDETNSLGKPFLNKIRKKGPSPVLSIINNRLSVGIDQYNLLGSHSVPPPKISFSGDIETSASFRQSESQANPITFDTLLYSFGGRTFLTDTINDTGHVGIRLYDTTVNPSIIHGYFIDSRDSSQYRTVRIKGIDQEWLAQNLRYLQPKYSCSDPNRNHCYLLGRMYTWAEGLNVPDSCSKKECNIPTRWQGICPEGWLIPSATDWYDLETFVGGSTVPRDNFRNLVSRNSYWHVTDAFGFNAIPSSWEVGTTFLSTLVGTSSGIATGESCGYYGTNNFSCTPVFPSKQNTAFLRCIRHPNELIISLTSSHQGKVNTVKFAQILRPGIDRFNPDIQSYFAYGVTADSISMNIYPPELLAKTICRDEEKIIPCSAFTLLRDTAFLNVTISDHSPGMYFFKIYKTK